MSVIHPEDKKRVLRNWEKMIQSKKKMSQEYRIITSKKNIIWVLGITTPLFENEKLTRYLGITIDITDRKKDETHLKSLAFVIENALEGNAIVDLGKTGLLRYVNHSWEKITGYKSSEVVNKKKGLIFDAVKKNPEQKKRFIQAIRQGRMFKEEMEWTKKSGKKIIVKVQSLPIKENGKIIYWHNSITDITEEQKSKARLMDSESRYRRLFESAKEGILILDERTGRIVDSNPYFRNLLEYSTREINGEKIWQIKPINEIVSDEITFEKLKKKVSIRHDDIFFETKSGNKIHLEFFLNVYFVDKKKVIQCTVRDITDRKKAEEAKNLEIIYKNLKEMDGAKSDFLNIVSHELKTPLTAILAHLDVLKGSGNQTSLRLDSLSAIKRNSKKLEEMIENILEISRIESEKLDLHLSIVDFNKLLNETIDINKILLERKGLKLVKYVSSSLQLQADYKRLGEIISNLLTNAIKFTNSGTITITAKEEKGNLLFIISDNGIGIKKEQQPYLFNKFYQADPTIREKYGGAGLGLYIVKKLVEAHNGTVFVESEFGKGSTFSFKIPIKKIRGGQKNEKNSLYRG